MTGLGASSLCRISVMRSAISFIAATPQRIDRLQQRHSLVGARHRLALPLLKRAVSFNREPPVWRPAYCGRDSLEKSGVLLRLQGELIENVPGGPSNHTGSVKLTADR